MGVGVVHPDVIKLVVVIVLSSKSIKGVSAHDSRVPSTSRDVSSLRAQCSLKSFSARVSGDQSGLVHTRAVNEPTEGIEVSILHASDGVIVSSDKVSL